MLLNERTTQRDADERALLLAAGHGDQDAFEAWFRLRWAWAVSVAAKYCPVIEDAEDAAAVAFQRAWSAAGRYRPEALPITWFWTIIQNVCIDQARAATTRPVTIAWDPTIDDRRWSAPVVDQPEARVIADHEIERVLAAIARVPDTQRRVVVAVALDDQTPIAIATATGTSRSTVGSRLHRGRAVLRHLLALPEKYEPPSPSDDQIVRLRASGLGWAAVARRVNRSKEYCRLAANRAARTGGE